MVLIQRTQIATPQVLESEPRREIPTELIHGVSAMFSYVHKKRPRRRDFRTLGLFLRRVANSPDMHGLRFKQAVVDATHAQHPRRKKFLPGFFKGELLKHADLLCADCAHWEGDQIYPTLSFCSVILSNLSSDS